jgi:hypothetical protein
MLRYQIAIASLVLLSSPTQALQRIAWPENANDMHFQYKPGECAIIRIGISGGGPVGISNSEGCQNDIFSLTFTYDNQPNFAIIPSIFAEGDSVLQNRRSIEIVDAWWTYDGAFYQPLWEDGIKRYAVVPEPSSWAMLLAGFGLLGGALRHRRTRLALNA